MHFSSIELYNFGIYNGLHTMNLLDQESKKNVTLVGGMNGRGKTTLLDSIFLCLYGRKASEFITGKKEAYNKILKDRINKSASNKTTHIKITMEMDNDENTVISIKRTWQQTANKIESKLVVEKNGIFDAYLSENWEYYVEELVPFGIAKFFFFDNEKISQIADDDAFDKIKDSIKSLIGVTTIESLCGHIEKIRKSKKAKLKKSDTNLLSKENDEIEALKLSIDARMQSLNFQRASLVPKLAKTIETLEKTEDEFWKKGGNLGINKDSITRDQNALKEKATKLKEEALLLASNPASPLCLCKELSIQVFNKISSTEEILAKQYSTPFLKKMYDSLLNDFKMSFNDTTASYNLLLQLINKQLNDLDSTDTLENTNLLTPVAKALIEKFVSTEAKEIKSKAVLLASEHARVLTALSQLEVHLSSSAEKAATIELLNSIKELQAQRIQYETDIAKCDEQLKAASLEYIKLMKRSDALVLKLASNADTSDDNVRILEYSTMTLEIMHEFVQRLQAQKVSLLEANITKCFEFLAQKQGIITSISINPETLDITLKDYNNGILLKEQLSAGEKQMFAISILWGLALTSGYKLPVVIDTPMARLDSAHRTNFINKYLPNASSQVIVLSTDEEIFGKYLEDIKGYVNNTYTLVYDEYSKCSSIKPGYFGGVLQ